MIFSRKIPAGHIGNYETHKLKENDTTDACKRVWGVNERSDRCKLLRSYLTDRDLPHVTHDCEEEIINVHFYSRQRYFIVREADADARRRKQAQTDVSCAFTL